MAKLADAPDLGSGGHPRAGSSPVIRITAVSINELTAVFLCSNAFSFVFLIYLNISSGFSTDISDSISFINPAAYRHSFPGVRFRVFQDPDKTSDRFFADICRGALNTGYMVPTAFIIARLHNCDR